MQELVYDNEPINQSLLEIWSAKGCPPLIFLPYSQLTLKWDSKCHKQEYETYGQNSLSPYSSSSHYSQPIDEEKEDAKLSQEHMSSHGGVCYRMRESKGVLTWCTLSSGQAAEQAWNIIIIIVFW